MRKKYKKLTFYLVVLVMGIGMITFPIGGEGAAGDGTEDGKTAEVNAASRLFLDTEIFEKLRACASIPKTFFAAAATPTPIPTPISTPEPTAVPTLSPEENVLLTEVPEDITAFVEKYFAVRLNGTPEEYRALLYDEGNLDENLTNKRVEYIVAYHDLKCYAKLGVGEIDYVVYVQNDVEIATIDTYAPSIDQLFIKYNAKGEPKLYLHSDSFSEDEEAYYDALRSAEDVAALIADVNERLAAAVESDEALRDFFVRLTEETAGTQE